MLPDFATKTCFPLPVIEKVCDGERADLLGAFPRGTVITFTLRIERRFGAAAVVMRLRRDTGAPGEEVLDGSERDLPFTRVIPQGDIFPTLEEYVLNLDTALLCGDTPSGLFYYSLLITRGLDTVFTDSTDNVHFTLSPSPATPFRMLVYEPCYHVSAKLEGAVMYHVFVDRFCRGDGAVEFRSDTVLDPDWDGGIPEYAERRGMPLSNRKVFGGNLWGVAEKILYLKELGVNVIYLSPIFDSPSNHKYDTSDYTRIDPAFGGEPAFDALIGAAHAAGISVILDGVFNHTGDDSVYFDARRRFGSGAADPDNPYHGWYCFRPAKDGESEYECWWNIPILPKLHLDYPACRDYFVGRDGICEKYIKKGIDGWRLDVADELPDRFLEEMRDRIRAADPDAALIGEVWENAADKTAYGKRRSYFRGRQLDSVMNYPLRSALVEYACERDASHLAATLTELWSSYPPRVSNVLMNIVGTHDTERILTLLGNRRAALDSVDLPCAEAAVMRLTDDERKHAKQLLRVVSALQYSVFGFPCVYYGDEAGLEGVGDPFCRKPMPWHAADKALLAHYKRLSEVRRSEPIFIDGDFAVVVSDCGYFEFVRTRADERLTVAANVGDEPHVCRISGRWRELYSGRTGEGDYTVPPCDFAILKTIE